MMMTMMMMSCISVYCRRLRACCACASVAMLFLISSTLTHCCSTLRYHILPSYSKPSSFDDACAWRYRPTCRRGCSSLSRSTALSTQYRSTTVQLAASSLCPDRQSAIVVWQTRALSVWRQWTPTARAWRLVAICSTAGVLNLVCACRVTVPCVVISCSCPPHSSIQSFTLSYVIETCQFNLW